MPVENMQVQNRLIVLLHAAFLKPADPNNFTLGNGLSWSPAWQCLPSANPKMGKEVERG